MYLDIFDPPPRVLVVDDETTIALAIRLVLEEKGCEVFTAHSGEQGLALADGKDIEVALLDIVLPGMNGIHVLTKLKERSQDIQVIMMTSHASVDTAIQAIRQGAYDYLHKPFDDIDDVWHRVGRAVEARRLTLEHQRLLERHERMNAKFSDAVMRLSSLINLGEALVGFRALPELADHLCGVVVEQMNAEAAALLLRGPEGQLRVWGACGCDPPPGITIPLGQGLCGWVAQTGSPVQPARPTDGPAPGPHDSDNFMGQPIAVGVPIRATQRTLGVLCLGGRRSHETYADEDVRYLAGVGAQAAIAIEHLLEIDALRGRLAAAEETRRAA